MKHTALTPVFVGLRTGLHALFLVLVALVVAREIFAPSANGTLVYRLAAALLLTYGLGALLARTAGQRSRMLRLAWLCALTLEWLAIEHEAGVLAERSRLAREIHDTLAQGLSSIQMLLHAAELTDTERPGVEHIRLARETTSASLADARRFIRELTPPELDDHGLGGALRRLAATQWSNQKLQVEVRASDTISYLCISRPRRYASRRARSQTSCNTPMPPSRRLPFRCTRMTSDSRSPTTGSDSICNRG